MSLNLFSQVGGVLLAAAAVMILSLMRDSIPQELRRISRISAGLALATAAGYALWQAIPGIPWPSWSSAVRSPGPAAASVVDEHKHAPPPAPKRDHKPTAKRPTIRELTPEEAEHLMQQIRSRDAVPVGR